MTFAIGEGFAGDGANAAHVNTMLGAEERSGRRGVGDRARDAARRSCGVRGGRRAECSGEADDVVRQQGDRRPAERAPRSADVGRRPGRRRGRRDQRAPQGCPARRRRRRSRAHRRGVGESGRRRRGSRLREQRGGDAGGAHGRAGTNFPRSGPFSTRASRGTHTSAHDSGAGRARDPRCDSSVSRAVS